MKLSRTSGKRLGRRLAEATRGGIARLGRLRRERSTMWIVVAGCLGLAGGCFGILAATWPDVSSLRESNPRTTAFIEGYREATREAGHLEKPEWRWVPLERISPWLRKAVLVAEDTEFFSHHGFSSHETKVAIREAIARRRVPRGASTITQQLARNLWLSPDRSVIRKVREALLTVQLERHLSKRRILELYLNVIEFGPGVYGAEAAARHYFGVAAADLDEEQSAMLAAGLPRPRSWHPGSGSRVYRRRVARIRALMRELTYLDRYVGLTGRPAGPASVAPPVVENDTSSRAGSDEGRAVPAPDGEAEPAPNR